MQELAVFGAIESAFDGFEMLCGFVDAVPVRVVVADDGRHASRTGSPELLGVFPVACLNFVSSVEALHAGTLAAESVLREPRKRRRNRSVMMGRIKY